MKPERCPLPKRKSWALCWYCWVVYGSVPDDCPWKDNKERGVKELK